MISLMSIFLLTSDTQKVVFVFKRENRKRIFSLGCSLRFQAGSPQWPNKVKNDFIVRLRTNYQQKSIKKTRHQFVILYITVQTLASQYNENDWEEIG